MARTEFKRGETTITVNHTHPIGNDVAAVFLDIAEALSKGHNDLLKAAIERGSIATTRKCEHCGSTMMHTRLNGYVCQRRCGRQLPHTRPVIGRWEL